MAQLSQPSPTTKFPRRILIMLAVSFLLLVGIVLMRGLEQAPQSSTPESGTSYSLNMTTQEQIGYYQSRLRQNENDSEAYAMLGLALLQQVRENGDPTGYVRAEQAFDRAIELDPSLTDALIGQGMLALARHDFAEGVEWAAKAQEANPYRADVWGVYVDGYVELGRYPEAIEAVQTMVDMRPGVASYSRVSYIRELHGKTDEAISAMRAAAESGVPTDESTQWSYYQLGQLFYKQGDWAQAGEIYQYILGINPEYLYAQAGLAQIAAASGNFDEAIDRYEEVVTRLPLPHFVIQLGELYEAAGYPEKAEENYELVHTIQTLNEEAGMDVEMEMALFLANHGDDPEAAVALARSAYEASPNIHAATALSWALYKAGEVEAAWPYAQESLRLGTQDALMFYHAGVIAHALDKTEEAQELLSQAVTLNSGFSMLHASHAQTLLSDLP